MNRYGGDREKAEAIYTGVDAPLNIAECTGCILSRPEHVNDDLMVGRPQAPVSQYQVHRSDE